jgi:hypothetical protein
MRKGRAHVVSGKLSVWTNKVGVNPPAAAFDSIERTKFRSSHDLTEIKSKHSLLLALLPHVQPRDQDQERNSAGTIAMSPAMFPNFESDEGLGLGEKSRLEYDYTR